MPPKTGDRKVQAQVVRPAISTSSLLIQPEDLLPGFEERIETGITWTSTELAFRHHNTEIRKEDRATVSFREALQKKIDASILGNIVKDSALTLEEQYELLPLRMWDNETFGTEEAKICFQNNNNMTDDLVWIVKETMKNGDRKFAMDLLKKTSTLRLIYCKMTELDKYVSDFKCLNLLNLGGNYIEVLKLIWLPPSLKALELQANGVATLNALSGLPFNLAYLGLSRNFLCNDCGLEVLGYSNVTVLDLSDNDIYRLEPVAEALSEMNQLSSLALAGNPCSLCAAYSSYVLEVLPRLRWLDGREVLDTHRPARPEHDPAASPPPPPAVHPDDLRSAYFLFVCHRIVAIPQPPKAEKGCNMTFHVELELPLLDSRRRQFLMYRNHDSLIQLLPEPEDYDLSADQEVKEPSATKNSSANTTIPESKLSTLEGSQEENIYNKLTAKNSREILNYTVYESARVPWAKFLTFQQPIVKIFCPDLVALRNTFRTEVTVRLVFTMTTSSKSAGGGGKKEKAVVGPKPQAEEEHLVLCSVVCELHAPDWDQKMQDFHWDDSLPSNRATRWEGDLSALQYNTPNAKPLKTKKETDGANDSTNIIRPDIPENLTCHFGFGVDTIKL